MRLQKISCGLIINAKHEHLEQPDRGCPVNNSERQQNQTSNNKTPHQYLKKGRKWDFFVLFCLWSTRHWFKTAFDSLFSWDIDYINIKHPSDMLYIFVL